MADKLVAVKGMNDLLPPQSARWEWVEATLRSLFARYGYQNVRTPIVEPTALFVRGLGEVTDIVEKEMYSFEDRLNGDRLTLRPEGTAGVVRAMNEHSFLRDGGRRLFYLGPMFRHERPQKGRYRQFHQAGVEVLGLAVLVGAVLEGVHLLLDDVGHLADATHEELRVLQDRGADVAKRKARHLLAHDAFEPFPARRLGRQDVVHAFDGIDLVSHGFSGSQATSAAWAWPNRFSM